MRILEDMAQNLGLSREYQENRPLIDNVAKVVAREAVNSSNSQQGKSRSFARYNQSVYHDQIRSIDANSGRVK